MQLVIDRKKWLIGEPNDSYLRRNSDGKMCCLGFLAQACGIREINGILTPEEVESKKWPAGLLTKRNCNTTLCEQLMATNDSTRLNNEQRESKIKQLMKRIKVSVRFINKY